MTPGTPAPQDAETVDDVIRVHRLRAIGRVYDVCSCDWYGPDHGKHVVAALAPVRAREVEAARRGGAREALEQAARMQTPVGVVFESTDDVRDWLRDLAATPRRDGGAVMAYIEHYVCSQCGEQYVGDHACHAGLQEKR